MRSPSILSLLTVLLLPACEVGFKEIGGDDGSDDATSDGDGDPGDGDGDGGPGDGDGDGDGDANGNCPAGVGRAGNHDFDYELTIAGNPNFTLPIDESCTITAITSGFNASLDLDCLSTDIHFSYTGQNSTGLELFGDVGDTAYVWLYRDGDELSPTWLRVDIPEHNANLFLIDAATLAPPSAYFPAPWGLEVVDSCGPIDDGCAVTRPQRLQTSMLGEILDPWPNQYQRVDASELSLYMEVARAEEIIELDPACDPAPGFFLTYRVLISSTGPLLGKGEVCFPGESNPCGTGLHCCYPCGIQGCDFVCTPEDANTMECPPPPP